MICRMLFGSCVSNKLSLYRCKYSQWDIKMIIERDVKRFDSFCFERDNCFVFQTLALLLQWPLLFIELESLGKQAKKELLCFQFEFENWLQRNLGSKHVENISSLVEHVLASWWWTVIKPLVTCCPLDDSCWCHESWW